jgi:two-component system chemotaxis sensor kinase CheA
LIADEQAETELETSARRAQPQLLAALQQLTARLAQEHAKKVALVALGLEGIPQSWLGALFDTLGQLLRNSVEHGIENAELRLARGKPEQGTLMVEFISREDGSFELTVHDDGGGLDAERIARSAVVKGLLTPEAAQQLDTSRLVGLIFQPGVSTAPDAARRGQGMRIVRDHVQRLGGRIQASTKRGQYTRYRLQLPAVCADDEPASRRAG